MTLTKREQRVIQAFLNCVRRREFSRDYATLLIEDQQRYGRLSDAAKEKFYAQLPPEEPEEIVMEEDPNHV